MWRIFGSSGVATVSLLLVSSGGIAAPGRVVALVVLAISYHLLLNRIARRERSLAAAARMWRRTASRHPRHEMPRSPARRGTSFDPGIMVTMHSPDLPLTCN